MAMPNTYTTLPVVKAQFAYDYLHDGDHAVYHWETEADQIVDFDDRVNEAVSDKLTNINFANTLQLPTTDSGLVNAIWIDTES